MSVLYSSSLAKIVMLLCSQSEHVKKNPISKEFHYLDMKWHKLKHSSNQERVKT